MKLEGRIRRRKQAHPRKNVWVNKKKKKRYNKRPRRRMTHVYLHGGRRHRSLDKLWSSLRGDAMSDTPKPTATWSEDTRAYQARVQAWIGDETVTVRRVIG